MARSSGSPSSPMHAQNSPRNRPSRRSSAARGVLSPSNSSPPPLSLSGTNDQEQFSASSSFAASDSFAEDDSVAAAGGDSQPDSSQENAGSSKKPAWNKPSNGATAEVSAVMGAESWPALSESARASPKSSSTNSLKSLSHGSIAVPEEMTAGSLYSQKEGGSSIPTPNQTSNHVAPTRQRSMKRGGGNSNQSSTPANGSSSQTPSSVEAPPQNTGKSGGSFGESYRDVGQRGGSYGGKDSSFRGSNGPQPRGDGPHHHGYGGRRDPHRSFGSRENHATQQRVDTRPFMRGTAPNVPFVPPSPPVAVRPFVAPIVYTEVPSPVFYVPGPHPDAFRPMPMVPVSPIFLPMPDPLLPSKIVNQIDYYFSNENLVKDTFLRQNMDNEGWVPVKLIAGFKKVMQLTDNIQLILDAIQASNVVEVQGDKMRRKNDWVKWIMPPVQYANATTSQPVGESSKDMLATHLNSVSLDETAAI